MSQIEHSFRQFLAKRPDIEKCYSDGLINRRNLARLLIDNKIASKDQLEAVVAMLRRYQFNKNEKDEKSSFKDVKITIKDKILILDFEKSKELLKKLQSVIASTDYDKGDTLKFVVSTSSIRLFIDEEKEKKLKDVFEGFKLNNRYDKISEISIMFSKEAEDAKGILSTITKELLLNNIIIAEMLTASPELILYLKDKYVLKAYEIIKGLQ